VQNLIHHEEHLVVGCDSLSDAGQLMNVLITKMENMDNDLSLLKAENARLKATLQNPKNLLRKMGLVSISTPLAADVMIDPLRADMENDALLMKGDMSSSIPQTNEEFHSMSWEEIHDMAKTAKDTEMI